MPTFYFCNKCVCRPSIILNRTPGYYPVSWERTVQTFNYCTRQPDVRQCSTPMTIKACEAKLLSVRGSSMRPCPGNWIAIRHAVWYCARDADAVSTISALYARMTSQLNVDFICKLYGSLIDIIHGCVYD